jgi:hypothetical protein
MPSWEVEASTEASIEEADVQADTGTDLNLDSLVDESLDGSVAAETEDTSLDLETTPETILELASGSESKLSVFFRAAPDCPFCFQRVLPCLPPRREGPKEIFFFAKG